MGVSTTLEEFLGGDTMTYRGYDYRPKLATYRTGVGIYVEDKAGTDLGCAAVVTDKMASCFYHNCAREK